MLEGASHEMSGLSRACGWSRLSPEPRPPGSIFALSLPQGSRAQTLLGRGFPIWRVKVGVRDTEDL